MEEVRATYRRTVGYGLGGTGLLILFGYWLILFTYPNLFYRLGAQGLPFGMGAVIDGTLALIGDLIDRSRDGFIGALRAPLMIVLPLMIWLLIGAAAVRAIRSRSWSPLWTVGINLSLGIAAFPILSWIVQLVVWVTSIALRVQSWIANLLGSLQDALGAWAVSPVILAVIVGVALIALLVWSPGARWVTGALVAAAGLGYLFRDALSGLLGPLGVWVSSAAEDIAAIAIAVVSWLLGALLFVIAWVLAAVVLAYLGSTMWTPLRDAARSGRHIDRFADVAAGVGVAVSTIITASAYNPDFARFLAETTKERAELPVIGMLPNVADLSFARVMPPGFDEFFFMLFKGFNGTPDLLIVVVACAIGVMALAFTGGSYRPSKGQPTIVTLGFLQVIGAMVAAVVVLWYTSFNSD